MLHCLGPTVQRIFSTLPGENTTLAATKDALDGYFAPKRNVVAERYKFRSRAQQPEESIDPYLTALRELAKSCDFAALEEGMVSLCLNDDTTNWRRGWDQRPNRREMSLEIAEARLLLQESLDLQKTMKLARSEESAAQETRLLSKGSRDDPIEIDKIKEGGYQKKSFNCYRCGRSDGHASSQCGATNKTCNACKTLGHLARVCRSKTKDDKPGKRPRPHHGSSKNGKNGPRIGNGKSQWCQESYSSDNDITEPVLSLSNPDESSSIQIKVNDKKIRMIVDTGSKYNIISSELYCSQFRYCELKRTEKRFTAYGQTKPLMCNGYFDVTLRKGDSVCTTVLYVIEGHGESLLGRDSSFKLGVLKQVNSVGSSQSNRQSELVSLLHEFDDLFHGLGKVTNFEHKIVIDPKVQPVSQHLRRIPLSQIEAVNNELDKMLEADVIEEVSEARLSCSTEKVGRHKT